VKKTAFYYGTISGIIMVLCFLVPYFIYGNNVDFSKGEIIGYTAMVLCLTAVFFGIRFYRDKRLDGYISFGQAMGLGSEISGIAALIFGIYTFVLYRFFATDLPQRLMEYYKNQIINSGQSKEVIAQKLAQMQEQAGFYSNPVAMAVVMMFTVFLIGIALSLISSFILKKNKPIQ
jgi:hypothetical protein